MTRVVEAKERFNPENFKSNHFIEMRNMVGYKVKVLVGLKPVIRVLKEDWNGFFITLNGDRVAVRPDYNEVSVHGLVGLKIN